VQDDPDAPDATYIDAITSGATVIRVSFPSPPGDLTVGAGRQEFRVLVRTS
jgi:hypothetical protein